MSILATDDATFPPDDQPVCESSGCEQRAEQVVIVNSEPSRNHCRDCAAEMLAVWPNCYVETRPLRTEKTGMPPRE